MLPTGKVRHMRKIIRVPINNIGFNEIDIPAGSRFLNITKERSYTNSSFFELLLWIEVSNNSIRTNMEKWNIYVVMTNEKFILDSDYRYISTVLLRNDPPFIVHIYLNDQPKEHSTSA